MAEHNEIGKIGESLTKTFLMKQGFDILDQNYRIPYGEIDIVAKKDNRLHFVEVKSIKVRDFLEINSVSVRPEDNLTVAKHSKLITTLETYLKHKHVSHETKYQLDLACVYINLETREGWVKLLPNLHKEKE